MTQLQIKKLYYGGLFIVLLFVCLYGIYVGLLEKDKMPVISSEGNAVVLGENAGKAESDGFPIVYLLPGTYELSVCAKTEKEGAYYEVIDKYTNVSYASKNYDPGEEYHVVRFTTDRPLKIMAVRSVAGKGKLTIYGYTLTSMDAITCSDAKRTAQISGVFVLILLMGAYLAYYKKKPNFLFVTVMAAAACLPYMAANIPQIHDIQFHLQRIEGIAEAIRDGQFPQRINTMFAGNGNITPLMYPQIWLIPGGLLVYSGTTVYYAFRACCVLLTFMTAYVGYLGGKELFGPKGGVLFTFLWVFNPFRMNEIMVRGALGEAFALAFLPLLAAGIWYLVYRDTQKGIYLTVCGATGIISSHVLTTMLAAGFCLLLIVVRLLTHPISFLKDRKRLSAILLAVIWVLLLNIWFFVPFLHFQNAGLEISSEFTKVESTGIYIWQAFMDPGPYGYVINSDTAAKEMSYSIGNALLFGSLAMFVSSFTAERLTEHDRKICVLLLSLEAATLFLSTSCFPWSYIFDHFDIVKSTLGNIQFPWRFLAYSALFGCFICVMEARIVPEKWRQLFLMLVISLTLASSSRVASEYFENPDYVSSKWDSINYANLDYNLKEFTEDVRQYNAMQRTLESADGPHVGDGLLLQDYHVEGRNYYLTFDSVTNQTVLENINQGDDSLAAREIDIPVSYFGLYHAYLEDGTEIKTSLSDYYQYTRIAIPNGISEGKVRLIYEDPLSFRVSYWTSLASAVLFLVVLGTFIKKQYRHM